MCSPAEQRAIQQLRWQVAYAWAISLNPEEAAALLRRLNLGEAVVDHAVEAGAFVHAFQLAEISAKHKLPDVHLKYAMFLEDSGRFQESEAEFLNAGGSPILAFLHATLFVWG